MCTVVCQNDKDIENGIIECVKVNDSPVLVSLDYFQINTRDGDQSERYEYQRNEKPTPDLYNIGNTKIDYPIII